MDDDIIRDCVKRVKEMHPDTSDDQLLKLELVLRRSWGGSHLYVHKRPALEKASRQAQSLAAGGSVYEAFAAAGVSRSHGFRLFSRRSRWLTY